jgi:hypothetical protein
MHVEAQSARLSRPLRRLLGVRRRVADTTLRDALSSLEPDELRKPVRALVRAAQRRTSLDPDELPFGVISLDGKHFSLPSSDDSYAQRQTHDEHAPLVGVVRTVTATLTSIAAQPIIDVTPIGCSSFVGIGEWKRRIRYWRAPSQKMTIRGSRATLAGLSSWPSCAVSPTPS